MTWLHVAGLALAVSLVLLCGVSHVCSATPDNFHSVCQLASLIAGGVLGHASNNRHRGADDAKAGRP